MQKSLYGSTFFLHTAGKKIFHEMKPIYSVRRAKRIQQLNFQIAAFVEFDVMIIQHASEKNRGFLGSERDLRAGN